MSQTDLDGSIGVVARQAGAAAPREKLGQTVVRAIRTNIAEGTLVDGDTLPNERELQERYGVSRGTVREALRTLEAEGLITSPRGGAKGARIHAPSADAAVRCAALVLQVRGASTGDIFAVRALLEPAAARLAAERRPIPDVSRLDILLASMRAMAANPQELGRLLALFNEELLRLSGNEALRLIGQMVARLILENVPQIPDSLEPFTIRNIEGIARCHADLEKIIDAIRAGKGALAEKIMKQLMGALRELHMADLPKVGEKRDPASL